MGKKVVINADDFGISHGTNVAIEKAYREGILTSASIMPSGPAFIEAVEIAKKSKKLGIGVHISLTWGKSILSPSKIPHLVDRDGYFYPSFFLFFLKSLFNRDIALQAEMEMQAQIERVKKMGIAIDHLNSQIHIHLIPWIFPIINRLAKKYEIKSVRAPLEPLFSIPYSFGLIKWLFLRLLGIIIALQSNLPKQFPVFYGILYTSNMDKKIIIKILKRKDNKVIEILSHPGYFDLGSTNFNFKKQGVEDFIRNKNRRKELESLLNIELATFIKNNGIQLINFSGVKKGI